MLSALLNQKVITTIHYSREELKEFKGKGRSFRCPHCSGEVNLRIGIKNVPHFAHFSDSDCDIYRQESPRHLHSKQLLYERLSFLYNDVQVEHYINELKQIADLYVKTESQEIAMEIQCSTIPISDLISRTQGYHKRHITPFWILTQEVKHKELLSLSSFQQAFIRYSPQLHYFLLHFLPEKRSFQLFTHLIPTSTSAFICSYPIPIPIDQLTLPLFIPHFAVNHPYRLEKWNQYRTKWIYNKLQYYKAKQDSFLRAVYEEGDTLLYLPLFVGLPVIPHSIHIKNHVVEWQYYIWMDYLKKNLFFTEEEVIRVVNRRIDRGDIELRSLPFIEVDEVIKRNVSGYLDLLEEFNVVERKRCGEYSVSVPWKCPDSFPEFELHQHELISKWKHILKKV
ncbi:competence protein CoiA family protein [Bacillus sp. BHET2]|uniref:competence protein CoiA n=1 Tax=Bacillus sp. BHET2 TaxID=2583818 RepID=UPI00148688D4|nr:competence protein CoiA family protein [Bacillus sp. BHET2]